MIDEQAQRSANIVSVMLRELRDAEACFFLFYLHKNHPSEWSAVRAILLNQASLTGTALSRLATLLDCSVRRELHSCDPLIPGLASYARSSQAYDLFD